MVWVFYVWVYIFIRMLCIFACYFVGYFCMPVFDQPTINAYKDNH